MLIESIPLLIELSTPLISTAFSVLSLKCPSADSLRLYIWNQCLHVFRVTRVRHRIFQESNALLFHLISISNQSLSLIPFAFE